MREVNIAMALITQLGTYHLQRRTGPKEIGAAGLVGCFGGKIDDGESAKEAIARELPEETNITVEPENLKWLENFSVRSDHQNELVKVNVNVYGVLLPHGFKVSAKEGELVSWKQGEIIANENTLTPATKEFFKRYFG
jgi:8-oxo-dGTP pyrophosphatase MutT (NUDIX family)